MMVDLAFGLNYSFNLLKKPSFKKEGNDLLDLAKRKSLSVNNFFSFKKS